VSQSFDYVRHHVNMAARDLANARGKRVLVVGCNRGREVSLFMDAGAREGWGIDVMDEVGVDYPRERVRYLQMSAESMDLEDNMFDIVVCIATMEHISRPEDAYPEICRVTAPGGFMYVVSSPLWNARQGHHRSDLFDVDRYPWIHLRFGPDELKRMCAAGEIDYPERIPDIAAEIDYIMNPMHINQRPARDYLRICSQLRGVIIECNELDVEPESVLGLLSERDRAELDERGVDSTELRALTHTLAGWKGQRQVRERAARLLRRRRALLRRFATRVRAFAGRGAH